MLLAPPMLGRPTSQSIDLTLIAKNSVRMSLWIVRDPPVQDSEEPWTPVQWRSKDDDARTHARVFASANSGAAEIVAESGDLVQLCIGGLQGGTAYRWTLSLFELDPGARSGPAVQRESLAGRFVTVRARGESFVFDLFADPHFFVPALGPRIPFLALRDPWVLGTMLSSVEWFRETTDKIREEFACVADNMSLDRPDFVAGLGDHFDLHGLDFNAPFESLEMAEAAHLEARRQLGRLLHCGAVFQILGNWEGESGCHPEEKRAFARAARLKYTVNPRPQSTPFGASPDEDYYAFEWGDLLLVALNVRGYTKSVHNLGGPLLGEGGPEDFTLGREQKDFLERTLAASSHPYKSILIHHAVGGRAGDESNSSYGRGGGNAAQVGEQSWVHEKMLQHGVQVFFYGHDHVFTDVEVDTIHYALVGTPSAPWRFEQHETGYEQYWTVSGHTRVSVSEKELKVEFVDIDRNVLHSFAVPPRSSQRR